MNRDRAGELDDYLNDIIDKIDERIKEYDKTLEIIKDEKNQGVKFMERIETNNLIYKSALKWVKAIIQGSDD